MQPIGTVLSTEAGKASVHLVRPSACQSCHACSLGLEDRESLIVLALDPLQVEIGQQVLLSFPPAQGLKVAVLVYSAPLIGLFAGYALLSALPLPGGALTPALGSLLISFACFLLLRLGEQKRQDDPTYLPRIERIIEDESLF